MSAMCLAEIVARCDSPLNEYVPAIHASFRHILAQSEVVLQVLYGVVLSLCCMGGKVSVCVCMSVCLSLSSACLSVDLSVCLSGPIAFHPSSSLFLQSLAEVLFPHLDPVTNHIQTLLDSSDLAQRSVALRVYDTLLVSACLWEPVLCVHYGVCVVCVVWGSGHGKDMLCRK